MKHSAAQTQHTFSHNAVRYNYVVWESENAPANPPWVLLHGFSQSAQTWEEVAPLLAEKRSVFAFEFVGHGGSDCPSAAEVYTLEAQAAALIAFLSSLVEEYRAKPVVVGYSMGGRIALTALREAPDLFATLVLEGAGLGPQTHEEREDMAARDARCAARLRKDGVEAFMEQWEKLPLFASQQALAPSKQAAVRAGRLANQAEALAYTFEGAGQHVMPSYDTTLSALRAYTQQGGKLLYLAGELDVKYCALAQGLADQGFCEAEIVAGAGHNVHLERPDAFVALLANASLGGR